VTERTPAQIADDLADRINRLCQLRISPETFHAEKSDIALQLRRLSRQLRGEVRVRPSTTWKAPPKCPA
jgi:hypothetical protein